MVTALIPIEILARSKDVIHDVETSIMSRRMSRLSYTTIKKQL